VITAAVGLLMITDFFVKVPVINRWATDLQNWGIIISAFTLGLAAVNMIKIHGQRAIERKKNWLESTCLLLGMAVMLFTGLVYGKGSASFQFLFINVLQPLSAAMMSLLVFYIASASYRAFRARTLEATILLVCGVLVMLGRAPLGELISDFFPKAADCLIRIPNMAGNRGIMIGAAIGTVATGLRVLLGIDRGHLGSE
jgi:hypothetical protein